MAPRDGLEHGVGSQVLLIGTVEAGQKETVKDVGRNIEKISDRHR